MSVYPIQDGLQNTFFFQKSLLHEIGLEFQASDVVLSGNFLQPSATVTSDPGPAQTPLEGDPWRSRSKNRMYNHVFSIQFSYLDCCSTIYITIVMSVR